jgi:hypothetical protein
LVWNSVDKCVKQINGGAVLSSAITGATNGLTKNGQVVSLGGTLTGNTTFNGTGSNYHLKYNGDYCSAFTARSIPDVAYVTGYTQCMANIVAVKIVCVDAQQAAVNDEYIGILNSGNTNPFVINLINVPMPQTGKKVTIADYFGNAQAYPITVCGQCYGINDYTATEFTGTHFSTINTDYGSVTFVFNGKFWSGTAYTP